MSAVRIGYCALFVCLLAGCPTTSEGPLAYAPEPEPSPDVLAMELAAHDLINGERARDGAAPLTMRDDLRRVARAHSDDMVARHFFDHVNPDGETPWDRMRDAGITYSSAGENIAWNNFPNQAQAAVNGWMNSTGHRNNILNRGFTHTGMGVSFDGAGGAYFTQVFIRTSKNGAYFGIESHHSAP